MAVLANFVGGSNRVRSKNVNDEQTINFYPEIPPGSAKVPGWLVPTPGLEPFVVLDNAPIRALFSQDGRTFAVSGTSFYEIFANRTVALRGSTTLDGRPATISSNGTNGSQLFVTSGGVGYIYDLTTNVIAPIADPDFPSPVEMGWFSDGYFGALKRGTNQFQTSALFDGTDWDALDVYQISTTSDLVVAQVPLRREIYTFGSLYTSVWQNVGASTIYQPIAGVSIEQGAGAPYAAVPLDNTIYFLSQNTNGTRMIFRFNGYTPERVSNHAVEFALNQCPRVSDAIAWTYQDEGHTFYVLYLPAPPVAGSGVDHTTWCYDVATGQWHERAHWSPVSMAWFPHVGRCHCAAWGLHLVGARNSGAIYRMSLDLATETLVI